MGYRLIGGAVASALLTFGLSATAPAGASGAVSVTLRQADPSPYWGTNDTVTATVTQGGTAVPNGTEVDFHPGGGLTNGHFYVGLATQPNGTGHGYWLAASDGLVSAYAGAPAVAGITADPNDPVTGIAADATGLGYWLVTASGRVFPRGDATGYGSANPSLLLLPVTGIAAAPAGNGYWLVDGAGDVFAFGPGAAWYHDASSFNNSGIVGLVPDSAGTGYWEVGAAGDVYNFGSAALLPNFPSPSDRSSLMSVARADDGGLWGLSFSGLVVATGDAQSQGNWEDQNLFDAAIVPINAGGGYWILGADGQVVGVAGHITTPVPGGFSARSTGGRASMTITALLPFPTQIEATALGGASDPLTTKWRVRPGYWMAARDGGVFAFGIAHFFGSAGKVHLAKPIVGMVPTPDGGGYWLVASDGGVFTYGDAPYFGSTGAQHLNAPIVGMAATSDGGGYWLVASDGGVFAFGDAVFHGSTGNIHLAQPIVGIADDFTDGGYWLAASDGGVFSFGDAHYFGSLGGKHLARPITGISPSLASPGYDLFASDGGVFAFASNYFGSTGNLRLAAPIVGLAQTFDGAGYWLGGSDGGVFSFGDAQFAGSTGGVRLAQPMVAMASTSPLAILLQVLTSGGGSFGFGVVGPAGVHARSVHRTSHAAAAWRADRVQLALHLLQRHQ